MPLLIAIQIQLRKCRIPFLNPHVKGVNGQVTLKMFLCLQRADKNVILSFVVRPFVRLLIRPSVCLLRCCSRSTERVDDKISNGRRTNKFVICPRFEGTKTCSKSHFWPRNSGKKKF